MMSDDRASDQVVLTQSRLHYADVPQNFAWVPRHIGTGNWGIADLPMHYYGDMKSAAPPPQPVSRIEPVDVPDGLSPLAESWRVMVEGLEREFIAAVNRDYEFTEDTPDIMSAVRDIARGG